MNNRTWLVVNSASGSNSDEAVRALTARLGAARVVEAPDFGHDPAALDAAGVGLLAVFAGDGTVNAVATALEGWGGRLLVLPGGTANLLARAIHGDDDALTIAGRLDSLRPVRRSCIRCLAGTALVEVLAGPGAIWSDVREDLREGGVGAVAGSAVEAIRQSTSGPMVALTEPALGRADGYAGMRLTAGDGAMEVDGYGAQTVGDYLKHGLALLRRNFRDGPHEDLGRHAKVTCRSLGGEPIALMIDGERREGRAEERFSLAPFALDLLGTAG